MLENIKAIYSHYRWARLATCLLLAGAGYLLFQIAGGFPPWAWRFLFNVLPRLTSLWAAQGAGVLIPFIGLLLLSLALLILWTIIVLGISQSIVLLWHNPDQEEDPQYNLNEDTTQYAPAQLEDYNDYDTINYMDAASRPSNSTNRMDVTSRPSNSTNRRDAALHPSAFDDQDDFAAENMDTIPTQPAQARRRPQFEPVEQAFEPETYTPSRRSRPRIPPVPAANIPTSARTTRPERTMSPRTRSRPHIPPIPPDQRVYKPSTQDSAWNEDVAAVSSQNIDVNQRARSAEPVQQHRQRARQSFEEQQAQLASQTRQFQQHSSQQVQSLRGAVPTYDPIPESTWSNANHTGNTGALHGHLHLVSEQTQPERHYSEDDEVFMEELNEELDMDGLVQTQYPRATIPIVVDDDRTQPTRTDWHEEDDEQEATLRLVVGIGLDPGLVRKDRPNEDSLFAIQGLRTTLEGPVPAGLFVIADGMGGHANGRDASRLATRSLSDVIVPALLRDDSDDNQDESDEQELLLDLLKGGVHRANLAIYQRNRNIPQMMGTTITTALVVDTTAYVVNVGDSRTYLYRPAEGLMPITRDHSIVARLVENGEIKRDDIYTHPQRNQIYRCLGEHPTVEMDTFVVQLQPDDILLLCSDGLWEMVHDQAMEKIIASSSHLPAQICNILVQAALSQGGADNISVIVVGVVKTTL